MSNWVSMALLMLANKRRRENATTLPPRRSEMPVSRSEAKRVAVLSGRGYPDTSSMEAFDLFNASNPLSPVWHSTAMDPTPPHDSGGVAADCGSIANDASSSFDSGGE